MVHDSFCFVCFLAVCGSTISVQLTSWWHGSAYVQICNTIYHLITSHIYHFVIYIYTFFRSYIYNNCFFLFCFSVTWRDSFVQFMHNFVTIFIASLIVIHPSPYSHSELTVSSGRCFVHTKSTILRSQNTVDNDSLIFGCWDFSLENNRDRELTIPRCVLDSN